MIPQEEQARLWCGARIIPELCFPFPLIDVKLWPCLYMRMLLKEVVLGILVYLFNLCQRFKR